MLRLHHTTVNPAPTFHQARDDMASSTDTVQNNGDTFKEDTAFTNSMAMNNMQTCFRQHARNPFLCMSATNRQGTIMDRSHVVGETHNALDQTIPLDPKKSAFFMGLNAAAT
ncbi:hypothetical protein Hypma_015102 [Hypsizygus marmoreus]|uniref:Uncharacterized protein n=1 Tax=Hypsizygus marmoreus TaxID=39966 RepID=A0A369KDZ8_HYPMA|nr:hypothetical protein Hypma_015102 [Hypsizygus marmoreus]